MQANENLPERFDRLYRDTWPKVYRLAFALAGNAQDAEDITQEAFFRAFRSFEGFRGESSFFTWIYRIAINVSNEYLRHRTKLPIETLTDDMGFSIEEIIDPDPANNPETEMLAYQVRIKCLHAMTECLPAQQRRVFCLAITLDLPYKRVAEILDISVGSVKTTLHRAKKRWLGFMENKCSLIRKSNPCNCRQFVRFGLSHGWIKEGAPVIPHNRVAAQAREEVVQLRALRELHRGLFQEKADESFAERLRRGIKNKEWAIIS